MPVIQAEQDLQKLRSDYATRHNVDRRQVAWRFVYADDYETVIATVVWIDSEGMEFHRERHGCR